MALKIIPATEPIPVTRAIVMLYTTAGWGKTSTGCTTDDPLIVDFDASAHRSEFRRDIVPAWEGWAVVANMQADDWSGRRTAVIDTTGRGLDVLQDKLVQHPGNRRRAGGLSQSGWGALKTEFIGWLRRLLSYDMDVLLLCHEKEDKRPDDSSFYRPDVAGATYSEIFKVSDAVAYGYWNENSQRVLDFNPNPSWVGKNPAHLEPLLVPDYHKQPRWMAGLFEQVRASLGRVNAEIQAVAGVIDQWDKGIAKAETLAHINELLEQVTGPDGAKLGPAALPAVKRLLYDRARALGLRFDATTVQFVEAPELGEDGAAGPTATVPAPAPGPAASSDKPSGSDDFDTADGTDPDAAKRKAAKPTKRSSAKLPGVHVGATVEFIHPQKDEQRVGTVISIDEEAASCVVSESSRHKPVRVPLVLGRIVPVPDDGGGEGEPAAAGGEKGKDGELL